MQSRRPDPKDEAADTSDRRSQTSLSKPPAAPAATRESIRESVRTTRDARRDSRAEPDDESATGGRIDVVSVEGPRDAAGAAVGSLRRELARLQQQAAAVERTLDEHRRERTDASDRLEKTTGQIIDLERRLASALAEVEAHQHKEEATLADLQRVAGERDALVLAVEVAKKASADTAKLTEELAAAKASHEALDAQLTEVRKRQYQESLKVTEKDGELAALRLKLEKANIATQRLEADAVKAKNEIAEAREAAAKVRDEADRARREEGDKRDREIAALKSELEAANAARSTREADDAEAKTERDAADAKAKQELEAAKAAESTAAERVAKLEMDLATARSALAAAEAKASEERAAAEAKASEERAAAEAKAARDLHALEEARAAIAAAESRSIASESRAMSAAGRAAAEEARALEAEHARATLEQGVRDLRREITFAFGRLESIAPPAMTREQVSEAELAASAVDITSSAVPYEESPPNDDVVSPHDSEIPLSRLATAPPTNEPFQMPSIAHDLSTPSRKGTLPPPTQFINLPTAALMVRTPTIPPPVPTRDRPSQAAPAERNSEGPELTASEEIISLSDELARSLMPGSLVDDAEGAELHAPEPTAHLSALANAIDASWGAQSAPPPADSMPPPASERAKSVPPPEPASSELSVDRDVLFAKLVDPEQGRAAAQELRQHPEWLHGTPPPTFVASLIDIDYDSEAPVFELARAWEREPLCQALVREIRPPGDNRLREHTAWLLKHLAAPSAARSLSDIVKSDDEPVQLRRWLLEALDRLAAGRLVGWNELGDVVTSLSDHADATIRDGVVGILTSLERSEEKSRALMEILRADDDEGVLSSAVEALASVLPIELDPAVAERLLGHKSARVQRSVRELIERARRESRRPPPA